jgi:hypothetical protein
MTRRTRRDSDIGVFINRSRNFSVGGNPRPERECDEPTHSPPKPAELVLRTFTGQVLEGVMPVPGRIQGALVWGIALVQRDGETSFFTAMLDSNIVRFEPRDLEAVNGSHATVSYLAAK